MFQGQNRKTADHRLYPDESSHHRQKESVAGIVHTTSARVVFGLIDLPQLHVGGFIPIVYRGVSGGIGPNMRSTEPSVLGSLYVLRAT